jgi:hypothetical protein
MCVADMEACLDRDTKGTQVLLLRAIALGTSDINHVINKVMGQY